MILAVLSFILTKLMPGIKLITLLRPLFITVALQNNSDLGRLTVEVSISDTIGHTLGLL